MLVKDFIDNTLTSDNFNKMGCQLDRSLWSNGP